MGWIQALGVDSGRRQRATATMEAQRQGVAVLLVVTDKQACLTPRSPLPCLFLRSSSLSQGLWLEIQYLLVPGQRAESFRITVPIRKISEHAPNIFVTLGVM